MPNLVGKVLTGRYRVDQLLGQGGMAEVYKVWDQERATFLALKLLREDLAQDVVFLRRFRREAVSLDRLQHPNIVRFYGLEQDGLLAFILMDYIAGSSLKTKIYQSRETGMDSREMLGYVRGICSALHYAHRSGIIHCDLKPGNVLIDERGNPLVTDFGIARLTDAATATMVGIGTPAYMAPEQVKGLDPVPQTDIYALGVILFEMVTGGERPFTGEQATATGTTSAKVRWEQVNLAPPSPRRYSPGISPQLEAVILKCLAKDPGARFQTALELYKHLEYALNAGTSSPAEKPIKKVQPLSVPERKLPIQRELSHAPATSRLWYQHWATWVGLVGTAAIILALIITIFPPMPMTEVETMTVEKEIESTTEVVIKTEIIEQETPVADEPTQDLQIQTKNDFVIPMVFIPAGEFEMGGNTDQAMAECFKLVINEECARSWYENEEPLHSVYLDAFWMDQYEVTNAQFSEFLNAQDIQEGIEVWLDFEDIDVLLVKNTGEWQPKNGHDNYPAGEVTWYGARAYCEWRGGRLPTEAEWEKAARGGLEGMNYPWGESFDNGMVNFCDINCELDWANDQYDDGYMRTAPVGSYPPNGYGLYDIAGNVWEWLSDWYRGDYYKYLIVKNPRGPDSGSERVLRGGSFADYGNDARVALRNSHTPDVSGANIGFRCAQSATEDFSLGTPVP